MSEAAARRLEECGGFWGAICQVLPALETIACVERASTSSGLRNKETGESFEGSGGLHVVVPVTDAADIPRFFCPTFTTDAGLQVLAGEWFRPQARS
jgi:hypothetical protein